MYKNLSYLTIYVNIIAKKETEIIRDMAQNQEKFKTPLVSVIIPCYNCESTIERTVMSVLQQTYENYEIILCDDCSSSKKSYEKLVEIQLKHPEKRIVVCKTEKNSGQSCARNLAMKKANGLYFAFIDSDDVWAHNKLEIQTKLMVSFGWDMSGTEQIPLSENPDFSSLMSSSPKYEKISLHKNLVANRFGMFTVMLINDGKYFFDETIRYSSDYHLWCAMISNGVKCFKIYSVGGFYDDLGLNRISSKHQKEQYKSDVDLLKELRERRKINCCSYVLFRFFFFLKKKRRDFKQRKKEH